MAMADELVSSGFQSLGYEYVNIDDCWANHSRAADGSLQADSNRFPHGIKYLADYMHSRGLKLGIYGDIGAQPAPAHAPCWCAWLDLLCSSPLCAGTHTCGGYPGTGGHFKQDAEVGCRALFRFATWADHRSVLLTTRTTTDVCFLGRGQPEAGRLLRERQGLWHAVPSDGSSAQCHRQAHPVQLQLASVHPRQRQLYRHCQVLQ